MYCIPINYSTCSSAGLPPTIYGPPRPPVPFSRKYSSSRRGAAAAAGDIVANVPPKDADAENVRTWLLMVLHRRSHPDPERIMDKLRWSGRDLHRASYLATRHRLRTEADSIVIAHDIHDAAKAHGTRHMANRGSQST
ncbi:hypothetical protein Hte_004880 [Hypoxylon texense]